MASNSLIKQGFIQDFGEAYKSFGLSRLMGHIVGLLLYTQKPLSLDDIAAELKVSKGPVSQIAHRLRDHNLIRKVWVPGSRKDFYAAEQDIFGQAFANQAAMLARNLTLARKYQDLLEDTPDEVPPAFAARIDEMTRFYGLMGRHLSLFLDEWAHERSNSSQ